MVDRIKELMLEFGLTSTQFADKVEVPRAVISHIISGRNKHSLEVATKIITAFPDVSLNWLLLGEGEMLKPLAPEIAPPHITEKLVEKVEEDRVSEDDAPEYTDKIQKQKAVSPPQPKVKSKEKEIEQIVIFYTDKTFTAYTP